MVVIIEDNPHLRAQVAEAVRRMGLTLAACYDAVSTSTLAEIVAIGPAAVIFPIQQAHASQWRLVRTLQALPVPPVLMALSPVDIPAIHQSALAEGVDYIFDPLLDVDSFLTTLGTLVESVSAEHRQQVA